MYSPNSPVILTKEKFQEVYTNVRLRNAVANAGACIDANGNLKYKQAVIYPCAYIVTDEQIQMAKMERQKAEKEIFEENKNNLLFRGMGSPLTFPDGNQGNYRFRTEFYNSKGRRMFIELSAVDDYRKSKKEKEKSDKVLVCEFSIDREQDIQNAGRTYSNNFKNVERKIVSKLSYKDILNFVNETYDCNFKKVVIDNFTIGFNYREVFCKSPKK